mgnify:CR=1 FL=1
MDERSLWGTALSRKVLEQCELVLAEVNPRMPNIPSDGEAHTRIHVSEVDGIIESSRPLVETPIAAGNETDSRIAGYIADLVPDGACIQLGIGTIPDAILTSWGTRMTWGSTRRCSATALWAC